MSPEKKLKIANSYSAKRELEREKMTLKANNFVPHLVPVKSPTSDQKKLSNAEMQILIGGLNRIAAEIQNISRLLARSVDES